MEHGNQKSANGTLQLPIQEYTNSYQYSVRAVFGVSHFLIG